MMSSFRKAKRRMKQALEGLYKSVDRVYDESQQLYDETNSLIYNTEDLLASPHWNRIQRGLDKFEKQEAENNKALSEVEARVAEHEAEIAAFRKTWLGKMTTTTEEKS